MFGRLIGRKAPPAASKKKPGLWKRVKGWFALASQVGERRLMSYALRVEDGTIGPLKPGSEILGTKRIEYIADAGRDGPWPTPWDQLTKLPLRLPGAGLKDERLGWLEVDLPYFVQHHATQLQVGSQENQPRAIADLYSLFAYILRVVGKIHIWSLRAPDYPDPYPIYAFRQGPRVLAEDKAKKSSRKCRIAGAIACLVPWRVSNRRVFLARSERIGKAPGSRDYTMESAAATGARAGAADPWSRRRREHVHACRRWMRIWCSI